MKRIRIGQGDTDQENLEEDNQNLGFVNGR